jgi:hypothetical protein
VFSRRLLVSVCFALVAAQSFAISWVVPADRFEIERASAIIVGRVLSSHAEATRFGIETVTEIALEETLKGDAGSVVRIHEPGGAVGDNVRIVPGAPAFTEGDRVLLLLYQRDDGTYTVSDLQLGAFVITKDAIGRELALRNESELEGWDPDGKPHREQHRAAEPFLAYIRDVVSGEPGTTNYGATDAPLRMSSTTVHASAIYTASSYTLQYNSGLGTRWNNFPGAVNWNQGNSETGALGSGTSQITSAFATWNAGGTNYVLKSATANTKGFLDPPDGVNNFVFERNLTSAGVQPFNCVSGGALGMGGMTSANFGAGAHFYNGEKFATTLEADVSMNQGLSACTTSQITPEMFKSVIVHELGHSLGFRHSDQNRKLTAACATDPTLECSGGAIMNHILVSGLNGHLQQWDNNALNAVYGAAAPVCPAVIVSAPQVAPVSDGFQLSIIASGGSPFTYRWYQGAIPGSGAQIGTGSTLHVNPAVTTSYWCRVTNSCDNSTDSAAVKVTIATCTVPELLNELLDQTVIAGTSVTFTVLFSGSGSVTWFNGDPVTPIGFGATFTTGPLAQTAQFHARVTNACGFVETNVGTIIVTPASTRRRAARH